MSYGLWRTLWFICFRLSMPVNDSFYMRNATILALDLSVSVIELLHGLSTGALYCALELEFGTSASTALGYVCERLFLYMKRIYLVTRSFCIRH